jgi:hypothetical protein
MSELFLTDRANKHLSLSNVLHIFALPLLMYLAVMAIKLELSRERLRTLWALVRLPIWDDMLFIRIFHRYIFILCLVLLLLLAINFFF